MSNVTNTSMAVKMVCGVPVSEEEKSDAVVDPSAEIAAFLSVFLISGIVALVFLVLYCFLRERCHDSVYKTRFFTKSKRYETPPLVPAGYLAWIPHVLSVEEATVNKVAGLDAVVFLRFFKLMAQVFAVNTVFGLLLVLPVNVTGIVGEVGFLSLTMSNVSEGSPRFITHLIFLYIASGMMLYGLRKFSVDYAALRHAWLSKRDPRCYTQMVTGIPASLQTPEELSRFFKRMYPENFTGCEVMTTLPVHEKKDLEWHAARHEQLTAQLEKLEFQAAEKGEPPMIKTKLIGGETVEGIPYVKEEIKKLDKVLAELRASEPEYVGAAFVSFNLLTVANSFAPITEAPFNFLRKTAPEPEDVFWPNLKHNFWARYIRTFIAYVLVIAVSLFWVAPITFVGVLSTIENLVGIFPWLCPVITLSPAVLGILKGLLPQLALIIFMAIIPILMLLFSKIQGIRTLSGLDRSVVAKVFMFELFNIYLITMIGPGLLQLGEPGKIEELSDPAGIMGLIAGNIPKMSTFFLNYVAFKSLAGFPGELLRLGPLIVGKIKRKWLCKTERELNALHKPLHPRLPVLIARSLLVALICISFCPVQPLINVFGCAYFALGYLVWKNNLLHVYEPAYQGFGLMWPRIANRLLGALIVFQLTFAIYFGSKFSAGTIIALIPGIVSILFVLYLRQMAFVPAEVLSLDKCVQEEVLLANFKPCSSWYRHPSYMPESQAPSSSVEDQGQGDGVEGEELQTIPATRKSTVEVAVE